jgi:hypothetical protein
MTITSPAPTAPLDIRLVAVDLYRDIHKGLRTRLFDITAAAGRVDPSDRSAKQAVAVELDDVIDVLNLHAHHEDATIQPVLVDQLPDLAERIEADHHTLEGRLVILRDLAAESADAPAVPARLAAHALYLEVASFTSAYLAHQATEETVVMPAIEDAVGVEACAALHHAIVSSIPPGEMAKSLAFMLPAMNVDDRVELLGGMRAGAPAEVFEGVWGLASSVLAPPDLAALAARLEIA